ncbi:glycosyltransferase [Thermodesulfobacteriota bacterium]
MSHFPAAVQRYLDKRVAKGPWTVTGAENRSFTGAVVIPSLAEADSLFATLQSLEANPAQWRNSFLVLVVVNHGEQAGNEEKQQNLQDLTRLIEYSAESTLPLAWIDAASPGLEIPAKQAGVGFVRKLGMDFALTCLEWQKGPLLVCLDADTLVEPNYLQTIVTHFQQSPLGAAVLPFRHQQAGDALQQAAIERYELFMRSYVYGLRLAGSPYAFNSVGSAIACRAEAYVRCGGMNNRKAGEDFYFLQKLAKTDGVDRMTGTRVFPEPRVSSRVPFGTGRSMGRLLEGDTEGVLFYPVAAFEILSGWLLNVTQNLAADADLLFSRAEKISAVLADYLVQIDWHATWPKLQKNHPTEKGRAEAFHSWFDGFRTLRLIHLLCDAGLSRGEPQEMLPDFFTWDGRGCPKNVPAMLEELRLCDQPSFTTSHND